MVKRYQKRLRNAAIPAFLGTKDMLGFILANLPLSSAGRLASTCIWLRGKITSRELIARREHARLTHGRIDIIPQTGIRIKGLNDETVDKRPIAGMCTILRIRTNNGPWHIAEINSGVVDGVHPVRIIREMLRKHEQGLPQDFIAWWSDQKTTRLHFRRINTPDFFENTTDSFTVTATPIHALAPE